MMTEPIGKPLSNTWLALRIAWELTTAHRCVYLNYEHQRLDAPGGAAYAGDLLKPEAGAEVPDLPVVIQRIPVGLGKHRIVICIRTTR